MSNSSRSDGDAQVTALAETNSFMVWTAKDDEGEMTYNPRIGHRHRASFPRGVGGAG